VDREVDNQDKGYENDEGASTKPQLHLHIPGDGRGLLMITVMLVMLSDVTVALVLILLLHWFWGWWTSILSLSGGSVHGNGDIRCNKYDSGFWC